MKKLRCAVFALFSPAFVLPMLVVPVFGATGSAFVADLGRDWSNTVNGNNGWRYNAGNVPLTFQQNWLGFPAWATGQVAPNLSPGIFKLDSADIIGGILDFQSNDVGILSGDLQNSGTAGVANITWTSSVAGTIEIRGRVWNAEIAAARDNQYLVKLNGVVLTSGMINHLVDTRAHPLVIAQNATVHIGDVVEIDFVKPSAQERGSFAGLSLSITQAQQTKILPQFVFGGGWDTTLYFTASTDAAATFAVNFNSDTGSPLNVPAFGGTFAQVSILAGGVAVLEAPNSGPLSQGYALVDLPAGVTGYAVFRQTVPGRPDQEASITFAPADRSATVIWDETLFTTAVAIVNLSSNPNPVTLTARGTDGRVIGTSQIIIWPDGKLVATLLSFPGLSGVVGQRGVVDFASTSGPIAVTAIRASGSAFTGIPLN
jgi:hypothetical protein